MTAPRPGRSARDPYFVALQAALRAAGIAWPALVLDRERLTANLDEFARSLAPGMQPRIVVKSLPSLPLLAHVCERLDTTRLMTFNLPMLRAVAAALPTSDQLLGKPLPVAAARAFLTGGPEGPSGPDHADRPRDGAQGADRVQWLVDTPRRLDQYLDLASDTGGHLRIALELDVGLHRGGFEPDRSLATAIERLAHHPGATLTGFMGYDAHVAHLPRIGGLRDRARGDVRDRYRRALDVATAVLPDGDVGALVRNGGGSLTHRDWTDTEVVDDLSVGSVLVKPSDFDLGAMDRYVPALHIATPVLKRMRHRLPGLGPVAELPARVVPGQSQAVVIHGGNWMAEAVEPPGLAPSRLYGRSSNQELLVGGADPGVDVDDVVFLRPRQSEAVMLQFGDLVVVDDGSVVDTWPVLPPSA